MNLHPQAELLWKELRNPNCTACELHCGAQTVCLLGDGPVPCEAAIIGEAPGWREDNVKICFSGRSGLYLRRTLRDVGVDPRVVSIVNVAACRPPNNRTPTRTEIKTCSGLYLDKWIERIRPRVILIVGNSALFWYLGRKGAITRFEGNPEQKNGITYVFSRHPSKVLRTDTPQERKIFLENILLFKRCLMGNSGKKFTLIRLQTAGQLGAAVESVIGKPVYVDIETNGLNPYKKDFKIWSLAFSLDEKIVYSVLIDHPEATISKKDLEPRIRPLFLTCSIIAQQIKFEGSWCWRRFGVRPKFAGDTKVNAYLRDENDQNGLKYRATTELHAEPWNQEFDFTQPPPVKPLTIYNAKDVHYGLRLYKEKDLPFFESHSKIKRLLDYIVMPAQEVFLDVERRGYFIDMKLAKERLAQAEYEKDITHEKICHEHGIEINLNSPQQVAALLYEKIGLDCPIKTKKGADSTGEAALIRLQGQHEIIDDILSYRKWQKYDSTYLTPWLRQGPILHALYGFTDTVTGRLNSTLVKDKRGEKTGASLHQCPRDPFIRNLIVPRKHGWHLVASDWSQIELRLVAHASGDPELCRIYKENLDAHLETAATLVTGKITKELRKRAKAVNFGFIYGMWAKKFRAYAKEKFGLDLTMAECEEYRDKFFAKYFGIKAWHSRVEAFVSQNGYVESIFGRIRHLPEARYDSGVQDWVKREAVRQGINAPIQGAACDLTKFAAALVFHPRSKWEFRADSKRAFLIGTVHDSQIAEVKADYVKEFKQGMQWTSENMPIEKIFGVKLRVPIKMDVEVYKWNWEGEKL
jgi:DNA polymerase-1